MTLKLFFAKLKYVDWWICKTKNEILNLNKQIHIRVYIQNYTGRG